LGNNKLSLEGQIQQMKAQNIGFNIVKEPEAIEYLSNHTYYFRLKYYAENYEKTRLPGVGTRYKKLEFAYLKELSLLDLYFRRVMFNLVQDVEHYAKIKLLKALAKNKKEDGYQIVEEYLARHKWFDKELSKHQTKYAKGLIEKYKGNLAVWNIIEIQTFSQFIDLYELYFDKYDQKHIPAHLLDVVKNLRNSIAHNNCIMFNLHQTPAVAETDIAVDIALEMGMEADMVRELMLVPFIRDLTITLYVFDNVVSSREEKYFQLEELNKLTSQRFNRHIDFFADNPVVLPVLQFSEKLVKAFYERAEKNYWVY